MATSPRTIPTPAFFLGLGGLLPFFLGALAACLPDATITIAGYFTSMVPGDSLSAETLRALAIYSLGAYGAVILSFLGGVRWGNLLNQSEQLQQWGPLTLSVLPSLIAWPALLLPSFWMLLVLLVGFVMQYGLDRAAVTRNELPFWFGRLRLILTTGATLSLLLGILAVAGV